MYRFESMSVVWSRDPAAVGVRRETVLRAWFNILPLGLRNLSLGCDSQFRPAGLCSTYSVSVWVFFMVMVYTDHCHEHW